MRWIRDLTHRGRTARSHQPTAPVGDDHGAVGSYVVHGLSRAERAGVERHLGHCAACRVEVHELSEAAAELGRLASRTPPPELRGEVLAGVQRHRPLPPTPASALRPAVRAAAAPRTPATPSTPVRTHRPRARLLPALALALAVGCGGAVAGAAQQHRVQVARAAQEDRLLTADDVAVHRSVLAAGRPVTLVVSEHQDRALLLASGLPALDPAHHYQLWTQDGAGRMAPGPAFDPAVQERVWLTSGVADAAAVAITVEPRGGSPRPTTSAEVLATF